MPFAPSGTRLCLLLNLVMAEYNRIEAAGQPFSRFPDPAACSSGRAASILERHEAHDRP